MNGWASTSHRTTSFAPPNSQGGAAGNRVSPLAFKWLATDATGCERAIFGNPRWTDAHRRTHRTTTSRRDQATRNGTSGGVAPTAAITPTETARLTGQYGRAVEVTDLRAVRAPSRRCHVRPPTPTRKRRARRRNEFRW